MSILSSAKSYCSSLLLPTDVWSCTSSFCEIQLSLLAALLIVKSLHGRYFSPLVSTDVDKGSTTR